MRPSALEAYRDGYNPRAVRANYGSWFKFLESCGALNETDGRATAAASSFLEELEVTQMVKSFKMLVLLSMINAGKFPGQINVNELAAQVREAIEHHSSSGRRVR